MKKTIYLLLAIALLPAVMAAVHTDNIFSTTAVYSGSSSADEAYVCWTSDTQKTTIASSGNWSDVITKAASLSYGGTLYVPEGEYTVDQTLDPPAGTHIIFSKGAEMRRSSGFNTQDDDNLLHIGNDNVRVSGGRFNDMNITASTALHFNPVAIAGSHIRIEDMEIFDMATPSSAGSDAGLYINESARHITVDNLYIHHNYNTHGLMTNGTFVTITNTIVADTKEDGFRTYGGDHILIADSQAVRNRVGFQSWDTGVRDMRFVNVMAINSTNNAFLIQGNGGACISCAAIGSNNSALVLSGQQNTITGFYTDEILNSRSAISVTGDRNVLAGIQAELNGTLPGINITTAANNNKVIGAYIQGTSSKLSDSGTDNTIIGVDEVDNQYVDNALFPDGKGTIYGTAGAGTDAEVYWDGSNSRLLFQIGNDDKIRINGSEIEVREDTRFNDNTWLGLGNSGHATDGGIRWNGAGNTIEVQVDGSARYIVSSTLHNFRSVNGQNFAELEIDGISGDGTGKAVCIKSDGNLGTCSDAVGAGGTCTCA